jgi:predicted acetyltransferase
VGILVAAEYGIYGRFGYGPAVDHAHYTVDARAARFRQPPTGSVELVDAPTMRSEVVAIHDGHRRAQPGEIAVTDAMWDRWLGVVDVPGSEASTHVHALGRDDDGRVDGILWYRITGAWERRRPLAVLTVVWLLANTATAAARLWAYVCSIDWVATVEAGDRSTRDPLPWLLVDGRVAAVTELADHVWVRPLDLKRALEGRTYLTAGRVVLEVIDAAGFANGRVALEGGPEGATVSPTDESPGLTLPVDTLGAAYVGGQTMRELARAGWLDVHDESSLATADAMFRSPVPPWCSITF